MDRQLDNAAASLKRRLMEVKPMACELAEAAPFRNVTEFFVRLRMKADSYKAVPTALSGIVEKIRIEAVKDR